jgi:RpiR family carbohydrate utilization transcriptional regulator
MPIKIRDVSFEKIPHNLMVKLQAVYDSLKTAERKAADLMLMQPEFFAEASIVEAAEAAGCSEATYVRLARRLGYDGYPELKTALSEDTEKNPVYLYEGITEEDDYNSVVKKVFRASMQALEDTLNVLNRDEYKKAVDVLCAANKLVFCGVGDASTVAKSGFQKFIRVGMDVQASPDIDVQLVSISHLKQEDAVIAISHSGRTKSILEAVKHAKSRGVKIISITNYPVSPLTKNSDIILLTAAFAEHMNGEVISKRVTELCILESLYINVLLRRKKELAANLAKSNQALEINKQ